MDRRDFQSLSRVRAKEAEALLGFGLNDGAYYLAGYAVECALKACIAKGTRRHEFPDRKKVEASHTHKLGDLVKLANLEKARLNRITADSEFGRDWDLVQEWSEHSRYNRYSAADARALVAAVNDRRHGVVAWIKPHW